MRLLLTLIILVSFVFSRSQKDRENYFSFHIGEPIYFSYSTNLFKKQEIRFISGIGTPDLIGFQNYSAKYNEKNKYIFFRRSVILTNNTYIQYRYFSAFDNLVHFYINGGVQSRLVFNFVYYRILELPSTGRQYMNTPQKTLLEFLPFLQLGLSYTTPSQRFIFGGNAGIAKNVFPIIWKFEPLMDVYLGINIAKRKKLTE